MVLKSRVIVKLCLLFANIGVFLTASPALAQDGDVYPNPTGTATLSVAAPTAVPDMKNSANIEVEPGVKLSFKQITEILKSSRNLSGRNLSGLNLVGMDLSGCNLKGADMRGSNLERADMSNSNLERVDFTGANLKMASFFLSAMTAANLEQAVLDGAIWTDRSICQKGSIGTCLRNSEIPEQPAPAAIPANPAN